MPNRFTLEYWEDDGWYIGKLKEIPGVFSQGESIEELVENVKDAYQMMLEDDRAFTTTIDVKQEIEVDI